MKKIPVAILGATGLVGQKITQLLIHHPWFEIKEVMASEKSAGKKFQELVSFKLPHDLAEIKIKACKPTEEISLAFSALNAQSAALIEPLFLEKGIHVISNASYFRMQNNVPLLIPEVNPDHLSLIEKQPTEGKLITNPNCAVTGLTLALKPLFDHFRIEKFHVVTLQAISGAGSSALSAFDISNNVIPFIASEEEKIESEPQKILGSLEKGRIVAASFRSSAQCNRVPVLTGHLMNLSIKFGKKPSAQEILQAFEHFNASCKMQPLFSKPQKVLHFFNGPQFPQPRIHSSLEQGLSVSLGGLKPCDCLDFKFTILVNNLMRGAAGAALLNAELFTQQRPDLFLFSKKKSTQVH